MASPHIKVKNGARGNALDHAQYIAGEGKHADRDDVLYCEDKNIPNWATDAGEFFKAADKYETYGENGIPKIRKAKDGIEYEYFTKGRAYKELEIAIPREAKDPVQWAKDYARETLGDRHTYRLAVHDKKASDGGRNVHAHLMFSTRELDGHKRDEKTFFMKAATGNYFHRASGETRPRDPSKGGATKSKFWNSQPAVWETRKSFERHVQRVVPSFKLERSDAPEQKIGPKLAKAGPDYERQREERLANVNKLREAKAQRRDIDAEIKQEKEIEARLTQAKNAGEAERKQVSPSLIDLGTDVQAAKREQSQPKSRTDELFAQLEVKRSDREVQQKGKENPLADFLQQRQKKNETALKPTDQKETKAMDVKQPEPAKDPAIKQQPQQAEQQREQANQNKEQEQPRSRTDDLFAQLERQQEQKRDERDRDGKPDLER
jgi:hypothetical protein